MSFLRQLNFSNIQRILLISVNAAAEPDSDIERSKSGPGPISLIQGAVNNAIDAVTYDSLDFAKKVFADAMKANEPGAQYYKPVLIGFEQIKDRAMRHCFENVGTRLTLPAKTIDELRLMGAWLLKNSEAFKKFLSETDGVSPLSAKPSCTSK